MDSIDVFAVWSEPSSSTPAIIDITHSVTIFAGDYIVLIYSIRDLLPKVDWFLAQVYEPAVVAQPSWENYEATLVPM